MKKAIFIFSCSEKEKVCKCGYSFQDHKFQQTAMNHHDQVWKYNTHTSTLPTNAYGEIEFVGHGDKVAKVKNTISFKNISEKCPSVCVHVCTSVYFCVF